MESTKVKRVSVAEPISDYESVRLIFSKNTNLLNCNVHMP